MSSLHSLWRGCSWWRGSFGLSSARNCGRCSAKHPPLPSERHSTATSLWPAASSSSDIHVQRVPRHAAWKVSCYAGSLQSESQAFSRRARMRAPIAADPGEAASTQLEKGDMRIGTMGIVDRLSRVETVYFVHTISYTSRLPHASNSTRLTYSVRGSTERRMPKPMPCQMLAQDARYRTPPDFVSYKPGLKTPDPHHQQLA